MMSSIKTEAEIAAMRESGRMLATILELLREKCTAGLTPKQMSAMAKQKLAELGGEPTFLGVPGIPPYPDVICISVNNQVQHSIPTDRPFEAGDVVNFDFGVTYKDMVRRIHFTCLHAGEVQKVTD